MAIFDINKNIDHKDPYLFFENYINLETIPNQNIIDGFLQESIDPDEGYGNKLRPIFIIAIVNPKDMLTKLGLALRKYIIGRDGNNEKFWHISLGFGPNLKHLYSFSRGHSDAGNNTRKGGLSFESIELYKKWYAPEATMQVSCILVNKEIITKVKDTLDYYIKNKEKTSYNLFAIADIFFNKGQEDRLRLSSICSQFVDSVLRNAGIYVSNRLNNLTSPTDLSAAEGDRKQFVVYDGLIREYDEKAVIEKVDAISRKKSNEYFKLLEKEKKEEEKKKEKEDKKENKK